MQFELQAISAWRLQAVKPLSHIPFEIPVAKGLLNLLDPSENGILGFQPNQLQAIFLKAVTEEKTCSFASLRQIAVYVLQYWGTARFAEVQDLKLENLVNRGSHFELAIYKARGNKPKVREIFPIYPTSAEYPNTFCPMSILSTYCTAHKSLKCLQV